MKDVVRILGVKQIAIQKWMERGHFEPSIERAAGPGTRNVWSQDDLYMLAAFYELTQNGFGHPEALELLQEYKVLKLWGAGKEMMTPGSRGAYEKDVLFGYETFAVRFTKTDGQVFDQIVSVEQGRLIESLLKLKGFSDLRSCQSLKVVNLTEAWRKVARSIE
jgi:hypothetical protein